MKPPQSQSRKRFYQSAAIVRTEAGAYAIALDGKTIKTPAGKLLAVPTAGLGDAIAAEWNAQGENIVPSSLPLTRLANSAIDGVAEKMSEVADGILLYASSDLVCYRAAYPSELASAQAKAWDPILGWVAERYSAIFVTGSGVVPMEQPLSSVEALRGAATSLGPFELAALHVMTALTGSALIALAHTGGFLDAGAAWDTAHIDESWQTAHWGEDFEAAQRLRAGRAEFDCASRFYWLSSHDP